MRNISEYTQQTVIAVTGLSAPTLQNWSKREAVALRKQFPGYGNRRIYCALDIVRLAIMRRLTDFKIALSVATEIADDAVKSLRQDGVLDRREYLFLRPESIMPAGVEIIGPSDLPTRVKYDSRITDPAKLSVAAVSRKEPVLVFPLGEIVHATLARLRAIDNAHA